ncbi:tetratricopeptide repeat protein [Phaeovulum vinaykumarii]|uniref:Flp pilus assembly protein TadD, contains TPR repeats n=1 Tax=Phaeovulum vinaykumarii TaxID=407234 RepID=A0A1N7L2A1_9RHOB|nr:tetratricopeptide repeat protein [Phaeovulum vinaykumarii]SIS67876.1 Flp pilus assembly protein TadD, contains TPR repeats [Phaeovulum vinaykumarii]SOC00500.1 Flp pilus assembly protein TadD [Phaeovulum vinaykumarii]
MRHRLCYFLALAGTLALSGCMGSDAQVSRSLESVNVIDATNLSEVMLTVADPDEAVAYFSRASTEKPDRIDLKRGLGRSLVRAGKPTQAVAVWREVLNMPDTTPDDRVDLAEALIRTNDWKEAKAVLDTIPPTHETYQRYRLEAMVADSEKDWKRADSFYDIAAGLTTKPAGVLNNWGYSKLSRGDYKGAEKLFAEALVQEPGLFTAKNNLVLARAAQGHYALPVVETTQAERAQLLYTAGLTAIKRGDITIGKGLLEDALETHPQHFEEAARALEALEARG